MLDHKNNIDATLNDYNPRRQIWIFTSLSVLIPEHAALIKRTRNMYDVGTVKFHSSLFSIPFSIERICSLLYALSDIRMKSLTYEAHKQLEQELEKRSIKLDRRETWKLSVYLGGPNLLVFAGDQHGWNAHKLQLPSQDWLQREILVDDVHSQVESLGHQFKLVVYFNYPIGQDSPHLWVDLHLSFNVVTWPALMLQ